MKKYFLFIIIYSLFRTVFICISLGEQIDVNNVLRLQHSDENYTGFLTYGNLMVEVRGDARGLPTLNLTRGADIPCCREWSHEGWEELNITEAMNTRLLLDINPNISQVWALKKPTGELISPPGPQNKGSNVCITALIRLPENASLSIYARLSTGAHETKITEIKGSKSSSWSVRRIDRNGHRTFRNKQLQLVIRAKKPESTNDLVLIQWISFCNTSDEASTFVFPEKYTSKNATGVFPNVVLTPSRFGSVPDPICLNGGRLDLDYSVCECAPGFSGGVCERGCGQNNFGVKCAGRCSQAVLRHCRGVFICSWRRGGCECVAGLNGEKCENPCKAGRYGSGCELQCGQCVDGMACNPYTGRCDKGCEGARQPPFCHSECGHITASSSLISYAEDALAEDFPWHVGVYTKQKDFNPQIKCGGTLVRPKYVLSAAHCFIYSDYLKTIRAEQISVAFGKTYNEWDAVEQHPERVQFRDVSSIHIPELYRGSLRSYTNDIALLKLVVPVNVTPYVLPICFDWIGGYERPLEDGEMGTIVGWGNTEKTITSHTLQKADLPYVPVEECLDLLPVTFQKFVTDDKFCVGKLGGAIANRGDSGGGLIVRQGPAWYLRGIVSVGLPDQTPFTVYTNVSHFRNWIVSTWNELDIEDAVSELYTTF